MADQSNPNVPGLGYFSMRQELPSVQPAWLQSEERLKREDETTTGDYVGSMFRQDGVVDGLMASIVGHQMVPDQNYNPFEPKEWQSLTEGIWPEHQKEFAQAHSGAHALFIKDRLLEKQRDLQRLGDLGVPGTIGRFALGAVMPENLIAMAAGSYAAPLANLAKASKASRILLSGASEAGINMGIERMRQSVNFEDSNPALLEAGLIGAVMGGVFGAAGPKAESRVADAASKERKALGILAKQDAGQELTPDEHTLLAEVAQTHEVIAKAEQGHISLDEAERLLHPEDKKFLESLHDDLRSSAEKIIDELTPLTQIERTKRQFVPEGEPLQLEHDPSVRDGNAPIQVTAGGLAAPGAATNADIERMIREAATKRYPKDPEKAAQWAMEQRAATLGYRSEVATKVAEARAAKAEARQAHKNEPAPEAPRPELQAAKDLLAAVDKGGIPLNPAKLRQVAEALGLEVKKKAKPADTVARIREAVGRAEGEAPAPKDPSVVIEGEKPAEAPVAPATAPYEPAAPVTPAVAAEAPVAPKKGPAEGSVVDWTHPRTGEVNTGVVERIREDGFVHLVDEDGKQHVVHQSHLMDQPAPEGFGPDSIGAARVAGSNLGGGPSTQTTRFSKARLDIFAVLNRSKSETIKELAFKLVKDAIQTDAKEAQYMTASEWKSLIKRTVGGLFHVEAREAAREAAEKMGIGMWKRAGFYHEFHSLVSRLTRGDLSVKVTNPDIAPMLERASKAQRNVYSTLLEEMKKAGVKGAENLQPNDFYVNRVWSHEGIRKAIDTHGEAAVYKLLATAINVPGFIGDVTKAKTFLNTVRKLEFSKVLQSAHLYAEDMGTLRNELARAGLTQDEIDNLVDTMFEARTGSDADKGRPAPLKYRFDINETLGANTPAGKLRIADLFENDARVLVDSYLNSMGGHIGLAKHGIDSQDAFTAWIKRAEEEALAKNVNITDDLKLLQDIYFSISGRPMSTQDFSKTARVASALRGYSRAMNLGQLGVAAFFEMKQAIGLMGFRAFWQQLPTFRQMVTAMRNGNLPDSVLARDLEHLVGFGTEMASSYARAHEIDEGFLGQMLSRAEAYANHASHAVDIISGNASFTSITRQFSSMMATQRLYDFAAGLKELTPKMRERLVGWGVDDHQIEEMLRSLKDHTQAAGHNGKVEHIDYERWLQDEPGHYEKFQTVVSRMTRDAIQDHDLGETMPFMHSTLGKVFGELKTFFLVAHAKNMLKNASYRDATALQVALIGFLGEALAYSTQTSMNYLHDPQKLADKLSASKIAAAAFNRSPVMGFLPFLADTGWSVATGGKRLFDPDMTTNTGNRTLVPPSLIALQRLYSLPSTTFGLFTGSDQVTRQEGLDAFKAVVPNIYGARNLGDWLTNSLPTQEPREP